jgi:SAM-dependent methyltransferase
MNKTRKQNPWLSIPASDYEKHMSHPNVGQLQLLNDVFRRVLKEYEPESIVVVGCTTGNGFEHINFRITKHVVGIDINPDYIDILRKRFSGHMNYIETICADVNACNLKRNSFDVVHCALLFEYVDPVKTVKRIRQWLKGSGVLSVVLQLEDEFLKPVSETGYTSLRRLEPIMKLLDMHDFKILMHRNAFTANKEKICTLTSGKRFYIATFSPQVDGS